MVAGAAVATGWHAAIQVPGLASLPHFGGSVQVSAVSCSSPGNCAAVGDYQDGAGGQNVFTAEEVHGTWQDAIEVLSTEFLADEQAEVLSISCPSAGNCSIGGDYHDGADHREAFVGNERNGSWEAAQEVPGLAAFNGDGNAQVGSLSCASAGNCSAGGYYVGSGGSRQAFVVTPQPSRQSICSVGTRR
jgi:hypothetical protein